MESNEAGTTDGAVAGEEAQDDPKQTEPTREVDEQPAISNAAAKQLPWVQELAKKAQRLEQLEAEQEKAKRDAELERAKNEERYEDALKMQREEAERELAMERTRATSAEMKAELLASGAKVTDGFLKVAVAEYDTEKHGTIAEFAASLKSDESYAGFFGAVPDSPSKPQPPGKPAVSTASNVDWSQVRSWETGDDPEKKREAVKLLRDYRQKHGEYPYKL